MQNVSQIFKILLQIGDTNPLMTRGNKKVTHDLPPDFKGLIFLSFMVSFSRYVQLKKTPFLTKKNISGEIKDTI